MLRRLKVGVGTAIAVICLIVAACGGENGGQPGASPGSSHSSGWG
jgi:hypothetical protein